MRRFDDSLATMVFEDQAIGANHLMGRSEIRRTLLEKMPKGGVCAEIGVWDGGFSEEILEITQPALLHLIDPWLFQPDFNNSAFGREKNRDAMEEKFHAVTEKFKDDARVRIHRAMSHEALADMEDASLDWVYLDGNHNYEVISNDIRVCLEKVKPNGIISGDDFLWKVDKGAPVRTAVREARSKLGSQTTLNKLGQQWIMRLNRA